MVDRFFCCTNNGEILIEKIGNLLYSFDPETLNQSDLGNIPHSLWDYGISSFKGTDYTINFVESLVLLDGTNVGFELED